MIPPINKGNKGSWAMRRLQRRRSAGLRPMPASGHGLSAAAAIAGALRDPLSLSIIGLIIALAIFSYGALA